MNFFNGGGSRGGRCNGKDGRSRVAGREIRDLPCVANETEGAKQRSLDCGGALAMNEILISGRYLSIQSRASPCKGKRGPEQVESDKGGSSQ